MRGARVVRGRARPSGGSRSRAMRASAQVGQRRAGRIVEQSWRGSWSAAHSGDAASASPSRYCKSIATRRRQARRWRRAPRRRGRASRRSGPTPAVGGAAAERVAGGSAAVVARRRRRSRASVGEGVGRMVIVAGHGHARSAARSRMGASEAERRPRASLLASMPSDQRDRAAPRQRAQRARDGAGGGGIVRAVEPQLGAARAAARSSGPAREALHPRGPARPIGGGAHRGFGNDQTRPGGGASRSRARGCATGARRRGAGGG